MFIKDQPRREQQKKVRKNVKHGRERQNKVKRKKELQVLVVLKLLKEDVEVEQEREEVLQVIHGLQQHPLVLKNFLFL